MPAANTSPSWIYSQDGQFCQNILRFIKAQCDAAGAPGQANKKHYMLNNNGAFIQIIARYASSDNTAMREMARSLYNDYLTFPTIAMIASDVNFSDRSSRGVVD